MANQVVNSFNDWDPLEEVIVGVLDGACEVPWDIAYQSIVPAEDVEWVRRYHEYAGGRPFESEKVALAQKELDNFVHILKSEGIVVRRPDPIDYAKAYSTLDWTSPSGMSQANPRDVMIVIGNEIIESPMAWRSRYFEFRAYRTLLKEYFQKGAKWTAAPKPQMTDELYNPNYKLGTEYVTTEFEPVFDAADIARCGEDLFVQRSQVTNLFGIEWLRRHLGETYKVHTVEFDDDRSVHIDATFVPLGPGKVMVNPDRPMKNDGLEIFKKAGWEILVPPRSTMPTDTHPFRSFQWLSMNVLLLDEQRIIVEASEEPMINALKDWGFKPIPCAFRNNYKFSGSFHCYTCDIRRRGVLKSYF